MIIGSKGDKHDNSAEKDCMMEGQMVEAAARAEEMDAGTYLQVTSRGWLRLLYPEEVVALGLVVLTVVINVSVHRTLNMHILYQTVSTYRTLFKGQLEYFLKALIYSAGVYAAWQCIRLISGRDVHILVWRRGTTLGTVARALCVYFLCAIAFGNAQSFIHRLSPIDRDSWLIMIDRMLFFGHDPLKLLEPLVTPSGVRFFIQIYISMFILPFVTMIIFLHQGKLRAFRDTILSLVLGLVIAYPGYLIFPGIGPQYTLRHEFVRPVFNITAMLQYGVERLPRDVFPSVHTAVSVIVLILIWRYTPSWLYRIVFTVWTLSIVFSTVYLRLHYVIDVIGGIGLSALVTYLGPKINDWYFAQQGHRDIPCRERDSAASG